MDFLRLVGTWGIGAAGILGIPAVIWIDPDTTAGLIVILCLAGLAGMLLASAARGVRAMILRTPPPPPDRAAPRRGGASARKAGRGPRRTPR